MSLSTNLKNLFTQALTKLELKKMGLEAGRVFLGAVVVFVTPIADKIVEGFTGGSFDVSALKGLLLAAIAAGAVAVVRLLQARLTTLEPTK